MLVCKSFVASEGSSGAAGTAFPDGESGCVASGFTGAVHTGPYICGMGLFVRSAREGRTAPMRGEPSGEGLEDKISEDHESDPNV